MIIETLIGIGLSILVAAILLGVYFLGRKDGVLSEQIKILRRGRLVNAVYFARSDDVALPDWRSTLALFSYLSGVREPPAKVRYEFSFPAVSGTESITMEIDKAFEQAAAKGLY